MTAPLLTRSVSDWLYNYSLSAAYRNAYMYDPDFALSREPDIWEIVRREPVIYSAMDRFFKAVVRQGHIVPPKHRDRKKSKLLARIMEELLEQVEGFDAARRRLATAVALGRAYEHIGGEIEYRDFAETGNRAWWVPKSLEHVDRRRFHWVPERPMDEPKQRLLPKKHLEWFNIITGRWEPLARIDEEDGVFRDHSFEFIRFTNSDSEDRLGYGRGLLEVTYFSHYALTNTHEKVAQGIDRWSNGFLIAKMDGLRHAGTSQTNVNLRDSAMSLLKTMRSEHVAVMENVDDLSVVETTGTGHQISMDYMRYLGENIERAWNGSVRPSGHGMNAASGARAQSETEEDTSEAFYQPTRSEIDEVISRDLIGLIWTMNWHNFEELGLGDLPKPRFSSEQKKKHDPTEATMIAMQFVDRGLPVKQEEVYENAGLTVPDEDDDLVKPELPAAGFGEPAEKVASDKSKN